MKKAVFFLFFIFVFYTAFSEEVIEEHVYGKLVEEISTAAQPVVKDNYIIFTAKSARHVGIAFDHENYRYIHSFKKIIREEFKGEKTEPILFYIMTIPEKMNRIKYRVVIDGLWSIDPLNPDYVFDSLNGMSVSLLNVPFKKEYKTTIEDENTVKFTYIGEAKKIIKLAGNFNNWDPFMYELNEISPGRYELNLNLPKGTWFYAYFKGSTQLADITNKNYVYTADGRKASVITVE